MTNAPADAARRLWARGGGVATSAEEAGAATQRVCEDLRIRLTRWVGAEGYRVLLERALVLAAKEHPILNSISCHNGDALAAVAAARGHGAAQLEIGVVALVTTLTALLGRIIGEEMAVELVERAGTSSPVAGSSIDSQGGHNG